MPKPLGFNHQRVKMSIGSAAADGSAEPSGAPMQQGYFLASCSLAFSMTFSMVKPNFFCSSYSGAEAPQVLMAMMQPLSPA